MKIQLPRLPGICLCAVFLFMVFRPTTAASQVAWNMTLSANWDNNSLPIFSGLAYNDIWGYAAGGREYAILGTLGGTYFIDITVPTNPTVVSFEAGAYNTCIWRDFKTYGTYAYGVADQGPSSLQVFDLSGLPGTVTKVYDSNAHFRRAHNIFIDEGSGRLYAAGTNNNSSGITVLDIQTNPANPTLLIAANLGKYSHDVYVKNDTVYCFMGTGNGWEVWDFTNLSNIQQIAGYNSYPEQGYCHAGWLNRTGEYLVHVDETVNTGIKISDVRNFNSISTVSVFRSALLAPTHTNTMPHNVFVDGNLLYVSYYEEGVQVFDISNPASPSKVAYYDTHPSNTDYNGFFGCWGVYPYLPSGTIIGSDDLNGLFVLQLNTPFPVTLSHFSAVPEGDVVRLDWQTEQEAQASHFVVERAMEGAEFEGIGTVRAAGNANSATEYGLVDRTPPAGLVHYRLRMVDLDGSTDFSAVQTVDFRQALSLVKVYPQPALAGEVLNVELRLLEAGQVSLQLLDLRGRVIKTQTVETAAGTQVHALTADVPAGSYLLSVTGGGERMVERLLLR